MPIWDDVVSVQEQDIYLKAGWGGRVGFGTRPAVLVVDMYRAFVDPGYPIAVPDALTSVPQIQRLLQTARGATIPTFFSTECAPKTPAARGRWKTTAIEAPIMQEDSAFDVYPAIAPKAGESIIVKTQPSVFFGTTLLSQLIFHGIDTLIIAGTVTSGCIRATCLDGFNYNYRVIVPQECVSDRGNVSHKVALFEIHMKYGDVLPLEEILAYLAGKG